VIGPVLALDGNVVDVVVVEVVVVVDDVVVVEDVVDVDVVVDAVVVVVEAVVVGASVVVVELVAGFALTTMVPVIEECTLQWYENVPGALNVIWNVSPGFRQLSFSGVASHPGLESNEPSSAVTE